MSCQALTHTPSYGKLLPIPGRHLQDMLLPVCSKLVFLGTIKLSSLCNFETNSKTSFSNLVPFCVDDSNVLILVRQSFGVIESYCLQHKIW